MGAVSKLAENVDRVVRERDTLRDLCGEIITTLTLPANRKQVNALGPQFPDFLAGWRRRLDETGK